MRRLTLERLKQRQLLSVVTNTLDAGSGSLRQAILDANATQQAAEIVFNIPGTDAGYVDIDSGLPGGDPGPDVFMIRPLSPLPALNNPDFGIFVDGTSQADFLTEDTNPFGPEIILDGSQGGAFDGLVIEGDGNRVLTLGIQRFGQRGMVITGDQNVLCGVYVGLGPAKPQIICSFPSPGRPAPDIRTYP